MSTLSFLLIPLGLVLLLCIFYFLKKIFIKKKLPKKLKYELKKEQYRQQKNFEIDRGYKELAQNNKILMEERKLKAINDPDFNLFYEEEKVLHIERLQFRNKSKWKGKTYYLNEKGKVFFISKFGKKVYKKGD